MSERIIYPQLDRLGRVEVQSLTLEETIANAPYIMEATANAYTAEFSNNLSRVDEAEIRGHYNSEDPERLQAFIERTLMIHECGARLAVVFGEEDKDQPRIRGYTKMGPAQLLTRDDEHGRYADEEGRYSYDGYYFNNILVNPGNSGNQQHWNQGLGYVLFHAGLTLPVGYEMPGREHGPIDDSKVVVLDAFSISWRINAWYQKLGFVIDSKIPTDGMMFGNTEMPQTYYSTPRDYALKGVVRALEAQRPQLANYQLVT